MAEPPHAQVSPPPLPTNASAPAPPHLRRVLGLGDLIFYGIVLIQPVGAVGPFGLANKMSLGHVTLTILIALVAMMLTAVSYGRMAGLYPAAGSAYTYVGRSLNPHLGFMAGWAMFLDYLVIPIVSVVYGALSVQRLVEGLAPGLSQNLVTTLGLHLDPQKAGFVLWVILLVAVATFLNLRGIKWTARANEALTGIMFLVIVLFVIQAIRFLWAHQGWSGLVSTEPFYNPRTFNLPAVGTATSLAALTYIGFDGITTLAEDVKQPKRTVPLAIVLVCLLIGLCAGLQVYLAQRVWPDYTTFKDLDTAFFDVCSLVGGKFLFNAMTLVLAVACLGSALTGQVGAARILFGMGRDNALPRFFARLDHRNNPVLNLWLIGALSLIGALLLPYGDAATLINFGAFLAFMGVNLAVISDFFFRLRSTEFLCWSLLPRGRVGRGVFWHATLWLGVGGWVAKEAVAAIEKGKDSAWIRLLCLVTPIAALLCCAWLSLALQIKRWHDRGKSGWWALVTLVPVVGTVWALVELGLLRGEVGSNPYGEALPRASIKSHVIDLAIPALALLFCLWIWLSLPVPAKTVGSIWCIAGLTYTATKTRGFRSQPVMLDLTST